MRIVWKDSNVKPRQTIKYRKHYIEPYKDGWVIDIANDRNIYASHYCAQNAIDKALGGYGVRGEPTEKRKRCGIQIIGQKDETA